MTVKRILRNKTNRNCTTYEYNFYMRNYEKYEYI